MAHRIFLATALSLLLFIGAQFQGIEFQVLHAQGLSTQGLQSQTLGSRSENLLTPGIAQNNLPTDVNQQPSSRATLAPQPAIGSVGRPAINPAASPLNTSPPLPLKTLPALIPTQFEQFVSQSTSQVLPLFGYELFQQQPFSSLTDVPVPANYIIGPGDVIDLKIWGAVDFAGQFSVDRQGQITLPKIGPVPVAGIQSSALDEHLKKQVARVFNNFNLSTALGTPRSISIYLVGHARQPGVHQVSSLSGFIGAVFESGGPAATGSLRMIELVRAGKKIATLDLYQFIQAGDTRMDTHLLTGDVIVIPPAGPRVALAGALDTPAIYELSTATEPLSQVLQYGAAKLTLVAQHLARLERIDARNTKNPRRVLDLTLNDAGLQTALMGGDIVTFLPITADFSNAITLRGNVANPLRYAFTPGMRISDLIPDSRALIQADYYRRKNALVQLLDDGPSNRNTESGNPDRRSAGNDRNPLLGDINWDYASIERIDPIQLRAVLIPFQLAKAIQQKDPEHNLELRAGDVVTIYSMRELPGPITHRTRWVKISGEVRLPGIYPITTETSLPEMIQRAGGLTPNAYAYGTSFTRESTRLQQEANKEQIVRQLESQLSAQSASFAQNSSESPQGLQALQAQIAAQRQSIERLKQLRANGRIALNLNPNNIEFPKITLEDADTISIPVRPSFVSVFGAVSAEQTLIYLPQASVEDYLNKVGPTRDADLESTLIIRADGTVLANSAQRSWFGFGNSRFMNQPIYPGDAIIVPEQIDKRTAYTQFIQGFKDWTQILYQLGLGAVAFKTLNN